MCSKFRGAVVKLGRVAAAGALEAAIVPPAIATSRCSDCDAAVAGTDRDLRLWRCERHRCWAPLVAGWGAGQAVAIATIALQEANAR